MNQGNLPRRTRLLLGLVGLGLGAFLGILVTHDTILSTHVCTCAHLTRCPSVCHLAPPMASNFLMSFARGRSIPPTIVNERRAGAHRPVGTCCAVSLRHSSCTTRLPSAVAPRADD